MTDRTLLAIDPGSSKCGLALVRRDKSGNIDLLWRAISARENVVATVKESLHLAKFETIVVGSGTRSKEIIKDLRDGVPGFAILVVDEKNTSLEAVERYWSHNPRKGWRRFVPATLQSPPVPVDDYVAMILAERVLRA